MKYAVVRIGGHQYKISQGEEVLVDKTAEPQAEVLLFVDGETVKVGNPLLKDVKVKLSKVAEEKGEKIHVFKYTAKSRYRKKTGFRHSYSKLLVEQISA